jgi:hypothetical protein
MRKPCDSDNLACDEADESASVVQLLVIDRPIDRRVRSSFNAENRAALLHAQRRGDPLEVSISADPKLIKSFTDVPP